MDLHLTGKIAVVTGASKGIGLAVTRALLAEGASVITGSRTITPELAELVEPAEPAEPTEPAGTTQREPARVTAYRVDLATPEGPAELLAHAAESGGLDILVNNVGAVTPRTGGFLSVTDADWLDTLNLSFLASVRTTRAAIPLLLERGGGNVVTIGSVNSYYPDPGVIDYSAAKAALWSLSKSLSKEYGPAGIRFNSISPGPVSTPLWLGEHGVAATIAAATGTDVETARAATVASLGGFSTGRFTEPEEVADLVLLLASDRAGNVTGADYSIEGGMIKTL